MGRWFFASSIHRQFRRYYVPYLRSLAAISTGGVILTTAFHSHDLTLMDSRPVVMSSNIIADVAETAMPIVVNISAVVKGSEWRIGSGVSVGTGSGFIISGDGFIATNAHVVGEAVGQSVLVTLWDGKQRSGIVHSIDFLSDIALVKIDTSEGDELQVARFGSSSDTRVGEFVIALGSPLFLR